MERRFAVIGYGSNPVPGQLVSKFGPHAVVPVILGAMLNADVVYNLISNMGYAFAELTLRQAGACANIAITFLDGRQLQVMKETEQNYKLAHSPSPVLLESGEMVGRESYEGLYLFAGFRRIWVPKTRQLPVPVAELPARGRASPSLTQSEVLQLIVDEFNLTSIGIRTSSQLSKRLRQEATLPDQPPKLKSVLQAQVEADERSWPPLVHYAPIVESDEALTHLLSDP